MVKIQLACAALALAVCFNARAESPAKPATEKVSTQTAVFAGGCFWGVDAVFKHVKGVAEVESGYTGGEASTAQYGKVSNGTTRHAEAVRIKYNPAQVSYQQLLQVFFSVAHDPTQLNRQGPDVGSQYRSAVFYTDNEQKKMVQTHIQQLTNSHVFSKPVVTQVAALETFYPAEKYHQNYLALHPEQPYIVYHDMPKLARLQKQFPALYQ
jgi:peptide-methionine (S)-S-oxide reductase